MSAGKIATNPYVRKLKSCVRLAKRVLLRGSQMTRLIDTPRETHTHRRRNYGAQRRTRHRLNERNGIKWAEDE